MKKVLAVGIGRVGFRTMLFLRELIRDLHVYAVDADPARLEQAKMLEGVEVYRYEPGLLGKLGKEVDLAVTALPSTVAFRGILELATRCVNIVDVSFFAEDPYTLEKIVEDCGSVLVVDAGFAPGYSNLVVGYTYHQLKLNESIEIAVGGIPEKPVPPLGYVVTWNPRDLLEEYTRSARYVVNYEVKTAKPVESVEKVYIKELGVFEGFVSDGLRTMLRNIRAKNMRELTIRWPGHMSAIKLLHDLGFLDSTEVEVDGVRIKPIDFTAKVLEKSLVASVNDIAVLQVVARGEKGYYRELALLRGTPNEPATPVFTALVHSYTAKIALENRLKPGVIPLEQMHMFKNEYEEYLTRKGVFIVKEQT
ncbi:MAG: saccharopine dehydrogenase C-terminal domain-containing protein [Desulfurococcaceae archaeon]